MNSLGPILRETRLNKGLSQYELARRAKVARPQIIGIEKGLINPRIATLQKLCAALDMEIHFHERTHRKDHRLATGEDHQRQ